MSSRNRSDDLTFVPGSDKADDVVTIGAHFDSWHTGTAATENPRGYAVMKEY